MKACYFCNPDIILTLLEAGADIDAETEQGRTALHELWYVNNQIFDYLLNFSL
jgi:ankyrin repeat protein